jgi:hypothetical protein
MHLTSERTESLDGVPGESIIINAARRRKMEKFLAPLDSEKFSHRNELAVGGGGGRRMCLRYFASTRRSRAQRNEKAGADGANGA